MKIGKVRWAFLATFGTSVGVTAFFIFLNVNNLNWAMMPWVLVAPLATGGIAGGFLGGITGHALKRGLFGSLIMVIVVFAGLVTFAMIDALSPHYNPIMWLYPYTLDTAMFLWFLPGIVISAAAVPSAMIGGVVSAKYVKVKPAPRTGARQKPKIGDMFKKPLFVVILVLAWVPLIVPLVSLDDAVHKDFSAWNPGPAGTSRLRLELEAAGHTNIKSCITSYSMLSRIDEPFVLLSLGPNRFYNPISDVPFMLKFLKNGGNMLVAHEHGTTSWLMYNMFIASLDLYAAGTFSTPFPMMFFPDGILRDNLSYHVENALPVIQSSGIAPHPVMAGVNRLVLNHGSGLMLLPGMDALFGWNVLASTTNQLSWVDKQEPGYPNGDGKFNKSVDYFPIPLPFKIGLDQFGISFPEGIPMGGFPIPVVAATEYGGADISARVIVTGDASMFSNQMLGLDYDNLQFALNAITWLTNGNKSMLLVFDEAHLRPAGAQDASAPAVYGQFLDYVAYSSSNWFIAPFYPFVALASINRWLPKTEQQLQKQREKKLRKQARKERLERRKAMVVRKAMAKIEYADAKDGKKGKKSTRQKKEEKKMEGILKKSTYFAQKLTWYLEQSEYNKALELLFNRIRRLAGKRFGPDVTNQGIKDAILDAIPDADAKRLDRFFTSMERVMKKGTGRLKIARIDVFERMYYEMLTVQEYLEKIDVIKPA